MSSPIDVCVCVGVVVVAKCGLCRVRCHHVRYAECHDIKPVLESHIAEVYNEGYDARHDYHDKPFRTEMQQSESDTENR